MIALFLVVNFVISIFNAVGVGLSWAETKAAGGWTRFMSWMGATMSAVGFSWCYLVVIALVIRSTGYKKLPENYVDAMFALGYLMLVIPLIGSGLAITLQSWAYFWRRRTFGSGAVAGWNTFADVYNIYQAAHYVPTAWDTVKDLLFPKKRSSSDNSFAGLAIALAIAAVLGGVLTTSAIIRTVSERVVAKRRFQYAARDGML
jgi:hypothetical protein